MTPLPPWPPHELVEDARNASVTSDARDYALSHGLVYRALPAHQGEDPPQDTTIHAPLTLLPTPFPRHLFEKAVELQPLYNTLYARLALDNEFIRSIMEDSVVHVDDFQARLYHIWRTVLDEGLSQTTQSGLFRSDYLMHTLPNGGMELKQVEFNTISASFGPLCTRTSAMHHFLLNKGGYEALHPALTKENMPTNKALETFAAGLADAHNHYIEELRNQTRTLKPVVLFIVQGNERNTFDQRAIEMALMEKHGVPVIRATFDQLASTASLHGSERILMIQSPVSHAPVEVSTVYFRTGYSPEDYTGTAWDTRLMLERSHAIKCPTIALQLVGSKKAQQVLAEPGVLEKYIGTDADKLRLSFAEMWPMDPNTELGKEAHRLARAHPENYVLKPQREGGGHNIYKEDIPPALDAMEKRDKEREARGEDSVKECEAYILMSLINTPPDRGNLFLRAGQTSAHAELVRDTVSELGIYGTVLFSPEDMIESRSGGFLLRTKSRESNEGGVAVGYSVIDTPLLV
ncbi:glutathione synthase [Malassezia furfur]|uniref:Glutathione synthetase n=1 Tax=Malassezia furfur TaxID=55194 RepID=A0ABY8ESR7_MALFU|nr:GSH2 [Malassezia furfur]WFD48641.1 glutathione synthase [Malassezia furfur]